MNRFLHGSCLSLLASCDRIAVVKGGRILFAGAKVAAMRKSGSMNRSIELQGFFLVPGFIDAHCHAFGAVFQKMAAQFLPTPCSISSKRAKAA